MTLDAIHYRAATPEDAAGILALTRLAYAKWVPLIGREPLPMTADYDKAVREQLFILAERDGALLGLVQLVPEEGAMLIENLAIHPDLQGMGLGGELLRRAEEMARSQERRSMRLYTNSKFLENIPFYARRGYVETARRELLPGSIAVFMVKQL